MYSQGSTHSSACTADAHDLRILADRTYGRAYATLLCPFVCLSLALCIVAKRCVLEKRLLLTAYRKAYMRNRLVPNVQI